ncbi:Uracil-DNA glycosylase, family 1 [hydrothermal vent metagenome]|uniref:uracil-DNA glycosylase n=1 Tax=hydrothermal vent metagenome TaxID=652676 RepID=A0A1W1BTB1_9ZZZZ
MKIDPKIDPTWKEVLAEEFAKPYMVELKRFLLEEKKNHRIFPPGKDIFNAYNTTPFDKVKVVILGQDPYHGFGQAHGLAFSVLEPTPAPPSLQNIFKELVDDIGCAYPQATNLTPWAKQGVFLLNTVLTVREAQANSHREKGWEHFTDATIKAISEKREHVVFILWGRPAQSKEKLIDTTKHCIIKSPHPSPLSAYRGFFGSKPFSRANACLESFGMEAIKWCL